MAKDCLGTYVTMSNVARTNGNNYYNRWLYVVLWALGRAPAKMCACGTSVGQRRSAKLTQTQGILR